MGNNSHITEAFKSHYLSSQRDGKRTPYNGKIGVTPLLKHLVKVYDVQIS